MTSQLLIPDSPSVIAAAAGSGGSDASNATVEPPSRSASDALVCPLAMKLPYQKTHQVELLNLQAETEALLQRLQILKQQKTVEPNQLTVAVTGE